MEYNRGKERKKFMLEQIELQKKYREAGMSEEDIREMFIHDLAYFNLCKREALHTVPMNEADNIADKKTEQPDFGWLENIDDEDLYAAICELPESWSDIIGFMVEGFNQTEIADKQGLTSANISRKLKKIKNILKKFRQGVKK